MRLRLLLLAPLVFAASGCTVLSVDSRNDPPRIESYGLINAHAALGIAAEEHLLHFDLFDGRSPGAMAQLVIWKLFRFELGFAGASITLGPLHLGLGVIAYDPDVPAMMDFEDEDASAARSVEERGGRRHRDDDADDGDEPDED